MNELDAKIIKIICSDTVRAVDFANLYSSDMFFDQETKLFINLALRYIKAYRATPTHRTLLAYSGVSYEDTINSVFSQLDFEYDAKEYQFDLERIKVRYAENIVDNIQDIAAQKKDPAKSLKEIAIKLQQLKTIKDGKTFTQKLVSEYVDEFSEKVLAREKSESEEIRIKTGYSAIDFANGGFRPAELFLLGGETGAGKSMFLMNAAIQMWMQDNSFYKEKFSTGYNITYFSLEMPYEDMYTRFLARMAEIPERSLTDGNLSQDQKERVKRAENFIKKYPYQFDIVDAPRGVTVEEIELRYQDALLKYEPHIVIVDYMGLMHSNNFGKDEPDWLKMGKLGGELHEFGRAHGVVVGSALQLTDIQRGSKQDMKDKSHSSKVGGHRIGRSSQILHHANFCVQIETREEESKYPDLLYHVIKNRRGPTPKNISIHKNFANAHLRDIPYIPQEQKNMVDSEEAQPNISNAVQAAREKIAEIKKGMG